MIIKKKTRKQLRHCGHYIAHMGTKKWFIHCTYQI